MANKKFHKLDSNNIIEKTILVDETNCQNNNVYDEATGISFCNALESGTWVGDVADVSAYEGIAGPGSEKVNNYFRSPKPHSSFTWNDTSKEWENPVANPEPDNEDCYFHLDMGVWVKRTSQGQDPDQDEGVMILAYEKWDGSSWTECTAEVQGHIDSTFPN